MHPPRTSGAVGRLSLCALLLHSSPVLAAPKAAAAAVADAKPAATAKPASAAKPAKPAATKDAAPPPATAESAPPSPPVEEAAHEVEAAPAEEPIAPPTEQPVAEEPAPEVAAEPAESAPADHPKRRGPGALPYILGGVGVALAGGGTVLALLGYQENLAASRVCPTSPPAPCDAYDVGTWRAHVENGSLEYLGAYIGWGVGGAAVVASVTWLLVAATAGPEAGRLSAGGSGVATMSRPKAFALLPVVSGERLGLVATGRF